MCVVATTLIARAASGAEPAALVVDQLRIVEFKQTIADLASFGSRYWDQPGNALAVAYIRDKLESFGYANVTLDPYVFRGELRHNVYATKVGIVRPAEMYIVSAHLDSFSRVDVRDAPGADDDASGTALVVWDGCAVLAGVAREPDFLDESQPNYQIGGLRNGVFFESYTVR